MLRAELQARGYTGIDATMRVCPADWIAAAIGELDAAEENGVTVRNRGGLLRHLLRQRAKAEGHDLPI